jgi:ABC-type branched-subunit amino acid transport system permease subunit
MQASEEKKKIFKKAKNRVIIAFLASLTLGLAPFFPEPHLFEKWRWLIGGAEGMQAIDWFDLIIHSSTWLFLVYSLFVLVRLSQTAR